MDVRTGKVFDSTGRELTQEEVSQLKQKPIKVSGENCTDYCAFAFKRNCFTVDKKFRAKCKCFRMRNLAYHRRNTFN